MPSNRPPSVVTNRPMQGRPPRRRCVRGAIGGALALALTVVATGCGDDGSEAGRSAGAVAGAATTSTTTSTTSTTTSTTTTSTAPHPTTAAATATTAAPPPAPPTTKAAAPAPLVRASGPSCVVSLHGKGGFGSASQDDGSATLVAPTGNAGGWGGRQWLYGSSAQYSSARGIVASAITDNGCGRVVLYGFSNGAAFAAKLYCQGETFGGRVVGVVVDDPVTDHAVDGCRPAGGVALKLYWTGALEPPAVAGWACDSGDWTCQGGTTIGIERIIVVMDDQNMFPPAAARTITQVLVTAFDRDLLDESLKTAVMLRQAGLRVQVVFDPAPLREQIGYADKKGIPLCACAEERCGSP